MHKLDIIILICVTTAIAQVQQYSPGPPAPAGVPSDYIRVSRQPDAVNSGTLNVPSFNCTDLADGFYSLGPCSRYFASCAGNTTNYMECPEGLVLVKGNETQCDYAPSDCEKSTQSLTSQTQTSETVSETTQYGSNATSFYGANSTVTTSGENNSSSTIQTAYTRTSENPVLSTTDELVSSTADDLASSTADDLASSTADELASSTAEYPTSSTTEEPLPSGAQALIQDYFRQRILNPNKKVKRDVSVQHNEKWTRPSCENKPAGHFAEGCAQFYLECDHYGFPHIHFCPIDMYFNEPNQTCDHEWNVPACAPKKPNNQRTPICGPEIQTECINSASTNVSQILEQDRDSQEIHINLCVNVSDGEHVSEGCSSRYFTCYDQIAYPAACPGELKFSKKSRRCEKDYTVEECSQMPDQDILSELTETTPLASTGLPNVADTLNSTNDFERHVMSETSESNPISSVKSASTLITTVSHLSTNSSDSAESLTSTEMTQFDNTQSSAATNQAFVTEISDSDATENITPTANVTSTKFPESTELTTASTNTLTSTDTQSTSVNASDYAKAYNSCLHVPRDMDIVLGCSQKYWECRNRIAYRGYCPHQQKFNQKEQKCDDERNVYECINQ